MLFGYYIHVSTLKLQLSPTFALRETTVEAGKKRPQDTEKYMSSLSHLHRIWLSLTGGGALFAQEVQGEGFIYRAKHNTALTLRRTH